MMEGHTREAIDRAAAEIERQTEIVSQQPRFQEGSQGFGAFLRFLRRDEIEVPPDYAANSRKRDAWLRAVWRREPHLAGIINSVTLIDANRGWTLAGGRNQVMRYTSILHDAEAGEGWRTYLRKASLSYWCTDMGSITEVGRDGVGGPLRALYHVDSARCRLTGEIATPLEYLPPNGMAQQWAASDYYRVASMPSDDEALRGLGFCLNRDATVLMADRSYRRIVDLVRAQDPGPVMSLDAQGRMVPKRITNWHTNALGGRRFVNLRGKHVQCCRGVQKRNSWVTEDHPILTQTGWKRAGALQNGELVATAFPRPNDRQIEMLIGTILGDASLTSPHLNARITMGHKASAVDWLTLKAGALTEFGWTFNESNSSYARMGRDGTMVYAYGKSVPSLGWLRDAFYPEGKKILPVDLVRKHLSPLLLATWYMDDGNIQHRFPNPRNRKPTAALNSTGSPEDQVDEMAALLSEVGYECASINGGHGGKNINFTVEGSRKFFEAIASYVPPVMRYKLPLNAAEFNSSLWELGPADIFYDEIEVSGPTDRIRGNKLQTVYCLDVEDTHNFVTAGLIVHNCAVSRCVEIVQLLYAVLMHDQEQLGARAPKGLLLLEGISEQQWQDSLAQRDEQLNSLERRYYGGVQVLASSGIDQINAKLVGLSQLPANFNAKEFQDLSMYAFALCFGYDPSEFWPVQFGSIGRGTEAEMQHEKATGKGGLDFALHFQERLQGELPETLQFEFEQRDDAGELTTAILAQAKLDVVATAYQAGLMQGAPLLSREEARSLLAEARLIPPEWTEVEEDLEVTDTEDKGRARWREQLLDSAIVRRAIERFPREEIVAYTWPGGQLRTVWAPRLVPRLHALAIRRQDDSGVLYQSDDVMITEEDVDKAVADARRRVGAEFAQLLEAPTLTPEQLAALGA